MFGRGLGLLITLAYRNVLRNPRRSLITISAIAVGILSSNMLAALVRGMGDQIVEDTVRNLTGHIQIHAPSYLDDPNIEHSMSYPGEALQDVLAESQVKVWASRLRLPGVIMSERESAGVTILGIEPEKEASLSFIGDVPMEGRFLSDINDGGVLVGRKLVENLQTRLGKRVVLMSQDRKNKVGDRGFRIVGVFDADLESSEKSYVFVGMKTLQKMLGLGMEISEVSLLLEEREELASFTERLSEVDDGLDVKAWRSLEPLVVSMVEFQSQFMYFWYVIVVIAVAFGLINTLFMAVYERTREIGLFQALGMNQTLLVFQVLFESIVLIIAGAVFGNLLTGLCVYLLSGGINLAAFAAGTEMFGLSSMLYPKVWCFDLLVVNLLVFVVSVLCSLYPAWRASSLAPVTAISKG